MRLSTTSTCLARSIRVPQTLASWLWRAASRKQRERRWRGAARAERKVDDLEVVWAVREEMARTVEDVLARRTRALLLGARASIEAAPGVAELMARELGTDEAWKKKAVEDYEKVARGYVLQTVPFHRSALLSLCCMTLCGSPPG